MGSSTLLNGLPAEAQPWVRRIEEALRNINVAQDIAATNSQTALAQAGSATTAAGSAAAHQQQQIIAAERVPETIDTADVTAITSTYFDAVGNGYARIDISIVPTDLATDGLPLVVGLYRAWVRKPGGEFTEPAATSPTTFVTVLGLDLETDYELVIDQVTDQGAVSAPSDVITVTTAASLATIDAPSAPTVTSLRGLLIVNWDGQLAGDVPPTQFRNVYARISLTGADSWSRVSSPLPRGGGAIQVPDLVIGTTWDVDLVAVDSTGTESDPSDLATVTVVGIGGPDIIANSLTANQLEVGSITVDRLASDVGQQLVLTGNPGVEIIATQVSDVQDSLEGTAGDLATLQTYYSFDPDGALISSPDSPFAVGIRNDQIEMLENGNVVSYWNNGQMVVSNLVVDTIQIGAHQVAKRNTTETVVRAL